MHPSVTEFIELNKHRLRTMYGFKSLSRDLKECKSLLQFAAIASNLMSNHYGSICNNQLCIEFRRFTKDQMVLLGGAV